MGDWFDEASKGAPFQVESLGDSLALDGILKCVEAGALVSLGVTSDGGALGVTVTVDGQWRREYFRDLEELQDFISQALPAVIEARARVAASSGGGSRKRSRRGL